MSDTITESEAVQRRLESVLDGLRQPASLIFTESGIFVETRVPTKDGPYPEMVYGRLALTLNEDEAATLLKALGRKEYLKRKALRKR